MSVVWWKPSNNVRKAFRDKIEDIECFAFDGQWEGFWNSGKDREEIKGDVQTSGVQLIEKIRDEQDGWSFLWQSNKQSK